METEGITAKENTKSIKYRIHTRVAISHSCVIKNEDNKNSWNLFTRTKYM